MLYLIRGLPGSGKTTFANRLKDSHLVGVNLSADDYFTDLQGNYSFDASKLKQAHEQCLNRTRLYLQETMSVAVSNTFTTEKEMQPYFDLAEELNHGVTVLIVENRHGNKSVHNVPQDTIQKMKNRFSIKL
jgi:predicted kinase